MGRQSFAAVEHASFTLDEGRTLALVGESGCGKTSIALALLRPHAAAGEHDPRPTPLPCAPAATWPPARAPRSCAVRGKDMAMVFQDPLTATNPVYTVGEQIAEGLRFTNGSARARPPGTGPSKPCTKSASRTQRSGAPQYPHQLSGGLRWRVTYRPGHRLPSRPAHSRRTDHRPRRPRLSGARSSTCCSNCKPSCAVHPAHHARPRRRRREMAHDVGVMYAGARSWNKRMSKACSPDAAPYTRGLLLSVPGLGPEDGRAPGDRKLRCLEGTVPDLAYLPPGCPASPSAVHVCRRTVRATAGGCARSRTRSAGALARLGGAAGGNLGADHASLETPP